MASVHFDPAGKTFLYIMYVEKITLQPEMADLNGSEVVVRWYIDNENDCSKPFELAVTNAVRANYCSFLCLSLPDVENRARSVTMTLSAPDGDHLGVAFLDLANFSREEVFKVEQVELKNQAGVVAVADLHTACQQRWSDSAPIQTREDAFFVEPMGDAQAER
ncbi:unnamed protein product, partial [Polarella glacialis]